MQISTLFNERYTSRTEISPEPGTTLFKTGESVVSRSKNLFRFLKKDLRSTEEITAFLKNIPEDDKYVGSLPESWRNKFKPHRLKEKTLEGEKIMSDFAKSVYSYPKIHLEEFKPQMKDLEVKLKNFLGEDCSVTPSGTGDFGKVFRVRTEKEDLALKVFHYLPYDAMEDIHGQTKEVANAIFLSNTLRPNQTSKFYCAKVTEPGANDAFMLTEYVEKSAKEKPPVDNEWIYHRFTVFDKQNGNVINGKLIDYGAVFRSCENENQKTIIKQLFPMMKKGDTKGIEEMKEARKDDEDFQKISGQITDIMQKKVANKNFILRLARHEFTIPEIRAYEALGVDFTRLHKYSASQDSLFRKAATEYGFTNAPEQETEEA